MVEPAYTLCLSGDRSCSARGVMTLGLEYKPIVTQKLDVRIKLSRSYERSTDDPAVDDIVVESSARYQVASDALDLRARRFESDGFEREEPRMGFAYEPPVDGGSAHNTAYASDRWFFGRRIRRGTEAPAHQYFVLVKFSNDVTRTSGTLPENFVQAAAYATFPFDESGSWRSVVSYTVQQQTTAYGGLAPYSNRLSASFVHDFSRAARVFVRFDSKVSTSTATSATSARANTLVLGGKFLF